MDTITPQSEGNKIKIFNVLHIISRLPVGGVENMLLKVVKGYDRSRFNPVVCCIKEGGDIADELIKAGIKVYILHRMKGHGFDWKAIRDIYRVIKKENIHILRTHQYHANLYGRIAGILAGVPVIIPSFHSSYISPAKPKLHRRIINHILSYWSNILVAVSNTVADDIIKYDHVSHKKIIVINNGIDLETFQPRISKKEARRKFGIPDENIVVGSVGRLKEEKGHEVLIKSVEKINDVTVAIAGDGPLKNHLIEMAKRRGIRCIFTGQIMPRDIPIFLRALDIFCFPSLWEGMPSALIEAMAAGLPIITSNIPIIKDIIGDAGLLVSPADVDAIAKMIDLLLKDPLKRERFGRLARKRAMQFSIKNTIKAYESLFIRYLDASNNLKH